MPALPGRAGRVNSALPPSPALIYAAIRHIRWVLDLVDDGRVAYLRPTLSLASSSDVEASAWMWACLLIADACDIDSMTLNSLASSVWRGAQDALNYQ